MNKYARFDEIPSRALKDIKETKRYGRTDGWTDGRTDNVKTVYPPTNTVCGGYKYHKQMKMSLNTSSPKGNDRSPESYFISIGTF